MKKRVFIFILFLLVVGVIGALALSPEFCYLWQRTPVLKDIYAWVDGYFKPFVITITKSPMRDIYLAIIGVIGVSIVTFGLLKVKKVKPEDTKYVNVNATPVINNEGESSVIVVEESRG